MPEAVKFDQGESSSLLLAPYMASGIKQLLEWGVPNLQAYVHNLKQTLIEELDGVGGHIANGKYNASHIATLPFPDQARLDQVHASLQAAGFHTSKRDGFLRFAFQAYNDVDEVKLLAKTVKSAVV